MHGLGSYTVGASINPEFVEWREQGSSTVIPFNTKIVVDPARTVTLEHLDGIRVKHGSAASRRWRLDEPDRAEVRGGNGL